ncbi:MAG: hypothetical protein J5685_01870 [Clostridiales bacterium]|nr:hypothetical protein [Clostridiales bacterium]
MNNFDRKQSEYFQEISKLFFERNFGQATKSEIELLMFHIYMEQLGDRASTVTDYRIGLELGITAQRVRNLKVKEQLKFPRKIEWKNELLYLMDRARYDDPYIVVDMPDPNLLNEIRNYLEENGKYVIIQRNPRLLTMRVEFFLDLIIEIDDRGKDKIFKELKAKIRKDNKGEKIDLQPVKNSCKEIIRVVGDVTTVAANLTSIISPQNAIGCALLNVICKLNGA